MTHQPTDIQLCTKAWTVLTERLGLADAMRFLSLIRNAPRDYQAWRDAHFGTLSVDGLLQRLTDDGPAR